MENNAIEADCENIDWDTEDELEISELPSSRPTFAPPNVGAITCNEAVLNPVDTTITCNLAVLNPACRNISDNGEGSSAGPSSSKLVRHFVSMGFSQALVSKVIDENGEDCAESLILETLLTYSI